jgi:hypothetical protein
MLLYRTNPYVSALIHRTGSRSRALMTCPKRDIRRCCLRRYCDRRPARQHYGEGGRRRYCSGSRQYSDPGHEFTFPQDSNFQEPSTSSIAFTW